MRFLSPDNYLILLITYNYLLLLIIKTNFPLLYSLENDKDCSLMNGCTILSDIPCYIRGNFIEEKKSLCPKCVFFPLNNSHKGH